MKILRHSFSFIVFFSFFTIALLFIAYAAFSAEITLDDCRALGLPVLTIETEGAKKIKSKEKYLNARYVLIDEATCEESFGACKIRGRGNTTWQTRELYKKPYLLKLGEKKSLLGLPAAEKWVLMANTADKTQLRNFYAEYLASRVWNSLSWTPQSRYISLFVNGHYNGLYQIYEKVEAVSGRVPVDENDGSFVFVVNSRQNKEWNFTSEHGVKFSIRTTIQADENEMKRRESIVRLAEEKLFPSSLEMFDLSSFAEWYLINELTKNHDANFGSSCYLYYDSKLNKIFMGPAWDFDIAAGNISWDDCDNPEGFWIKNAVWYEALFENPAFKKLVKQKWSEKREAVTASFDFIQQEASSLKVAVLLNDAVWKNIGHRQWPHAPGWKKRKTYESEVEYMIDFLKKRSQWLDSALFSL
ncbi:MAG: CotH kinase family protein [Spirochaetaceae bacterium]|nr:CotH kinase family protein [Spirochaetaceae bacterium]